MTRYFIGIDLGGTYTKFVVLDEQRRWGEVLELPTPRDGAAGEIVAQIADGARKAARAAGAPLEQVDGVGLGSPGPLKPSAGIVLDSPNIPALKNTPLRDMVARELSLPTVLENDANAAAYGEYICGAGVEARIMVLLTLGTGIGSGIIMDGEIFHGAHEIGAEIGHMIIVPQGLRCGCGQNGCLERYCSATYMAENTARALQETSTKSTLRKVMEEKGDIDSLDIQRAAEAGDAFAERMWEQAAYYLAVGCVNICRIFDPDKIVLAGGMARAGQTLINPLIEHFARLNWSMTDVATEIITAELGPDAGAIGAAGVAQKQLTGE